MSARCIMVDGALVRVSHEFDETEGSEDMIAAPAPRRSSVCHALA